MRRLAFQILFSLSAVLLGAEGTMAAAPANHSRQLSFENRPWFGDFDAMLERRRIRVVLPYSRTLYYNDKGRERGITVELVRDFEQYLNRKYAKRLRKRPLTIYVIPATRDVLIGDVAKGLADIAAGNLTETPTRLRRVDFVAPRDRGPVRELVVTGPSSPVIANRDDLAGKRVHVRKASSYYTSLVALNQRFRQERKARMTLRVVSDALEDEDLMEMLNAGLVELLVVDDWKAKLWARVLPRIKVTDVAVSDAGYIGWAIRKGSPGLAREINEFYHKWAKKTGAIEFRIVQYQQRIRQISNANATGAWKRLEQMMALFEKYGAKYRFDPLMLAAQGYQESRLEQKKRSPAGAIGVMQLMPATGASLKVGDIRKLEPNIHAGAKYMDRLMTTYFPDAHLSEQDRALFALASYNAGPVRMVQMRNEAKRRGLDPDKWFNNVEIVVAEKVGIETTTYVRNIFKYYTAYKLQREVLDERREARRKLHSTVK